jgi:GNAT superfamily N-acetyltransferase
MIRRASSADLETLIPLIAEFAALDRHTFEEAVVRSALVPLLESDRLGVVWMIGDPPQGYAVVTWGYSLESGGRDALVDELYLRERGRGIGGAALEAMVADLEARGMRRVFLETEAHNERVRGFYARHGFSEEDSVWMVRDLPK